MLNKFIILFAVFAILFGECSNAGKFLVLFMLKCIIITTWYVSGIAISIMTSKFHSNHNPDLIEVNSNNESEGLNQLIDVSNLKLLGSEETDQLELSNQFTSSESIKLNTFANNIIEENSKLKLSNEGLNQIQNLGNYKFFKDNQGKLIFGSQVDGLNSTFAMISFIIMLLLLI